MALMQPDKQNDHHYANMKIRILFCSHYSSAIIPELPGISQFKGRVVHSYSFRDPVDMQGQKVLIVGAGPSGRDIAMEIVELATQVNNDIVVLKPKYPKYSFICSNACWFDLITNKLCVCHNKPTLAVSQMLIPLWWNFTLILVSLVSFSKCNFPSRSIATFTIDNTGFSNWGFRYTHHSSVSKYVHCLFALINLFIRNDNKYDFNFCCHHISGLSESSGSTFSVFE